MTNRIHEFRNMVDHLADVPISVVKKEEEYTNSSPFRQKYHVESESGTLGDPNGFSYFNGKYHLFYQWSPLAFSNDPHYTQHGWKHLISDNLIDWQDLGPAIESDTKYDRYGTYSGSAISKNDKLLMFYTGNTWINTDTQNNWVRVPYQLTAFMDENNRVHRSSSPIIEGTFEGYTAHFRDPKVWEKDNQYYAIFGVQRKNLSGTALIFQSNDFKKWHSLGELKTKYTSLGYMWECPDYFELADKGVLIFCPQGLNSDGGKYQNIYQTCYLLGDKLTLPQTKFNHNQLQELDNGFDLYASQTMLAPDGRRIIFSWMGLPETQYPTEKYHYSGCMTIPKELRIKNGKLYQIPVQELKSLRGESRSIDQQLTNKEVSYDLHQIANELDVTVKFETANAVILDLCADETDQHRFRIILNKKKNEIMIDRSQSGLEVSSEYGVTRKIDYKIKDEITLQIFIDSSSIEIFISGGEKVFTSRIFPNQDQTQVFVKALSGTANIDGTMYAMR